MKYSLLLWCMKKLPIALIALTMTLGVSCKKSNDLADSKPSTENKKVIEKSTDLKPTVLGLYDDGGIGGYPGGENTYPHNTGACYCGMYSVCHPTTYYDGHGNGHVSYPGQTTFPPGSTFPGNTVN